MPIPFKKVALTTVVLQRAQGSEAFPWHTIKSSPVMPAFGSKGQELAVLPEPLHIAANPRQAFSSLVLHHGIKDYLP